MNDSVMKEEEPPGAAKSEILITKKDTNGDDSKCDSTDTAAIISEAVAELDEKIEDKSEGPELDKIPMNERRRWLIQVRMILRLTVRDKFGVRFSNRCGHWLDRYMSHLVWMYGYWLDYPTGNHVLQGHSGTVWAAAVSTDGRYLFTAGYGGSIIVWDLLDHSMLKQIDVSERPIYCLIYECDLLVSGSKDKKIRIFNGITHELIRTLIGHSCYAHSIQFNKECNQLVSASDDKSVKIWCIQTGNCLATLTGHTWAVYSAYFMDNDTTVITGSRDDSMKVWSVKDKIETDTIINGNKDRIYDIYVNCDSSLVACCSGSTGIMIYNWPNMDIVRTVQMTAFRSGFHPRNPEILAIAVSYSNSVNIYNVQSGDTLVEWEGHSDEIKRFCWSRDGSRLVSVGDDDTVRVWDCTRLFE